MWRPIEIASLPIYQPNQHMSMKVVIVWLCYVVLMLMSCTNPAAGVASDRLASVVGEVAAAAAGPFTSDRVNRVIGDDTKPNRFVPSSHNRVSERIVVASASVCE
jgi:hypothetical protein